MDRGLVDQVVDVEAEVGVDAFAGRAGFHFGAGFVVGDRGEAEVAVEDAGEDGDLFLGEEGVRAGEFVDRAVVEVGVAEGFRGDGGDVLGVDERGAAPGEGDADDVAGGELGSQRSELDMKARGRRKVQVMPDSRMARSLRVM
ncbi:hypothetical protein ACU686_05395 [Yinghuangia aomiensis]